MKSIILVIIFFFVCHTTFSQVIHFKVIDVRALKVMQDVVVTSSLVPADINKTDKGGNVFINHLDSDTITFYKPFYYPVKLHIRHKAYDFNHIVEVVMVPSVQESHQFGKGNVQAFEYHFVHDTLGNESHMKVIALEHTDAFNVRSQWNEKSFRFAHIDLKGNDKGTDNYSLKEDE